MILKKEIQINHALAVINKKEVCNTVLVHVSYIVGIVILKINIEDHVKIVKEK